MSTTKPTPEEVAAARAAFMALHDAAELERQKWVALVAASAEFGLGDIVERKRNGSGLKRGSTIVTEYRITRIVVRADHHSRGHVTFHGVQRLANGKWGDREWELYGFQSVTLKERAPTTG